MKTIISIIATAMTLTANAQAPKLAKVAESPKWNWNGVAVSNDGRIFANFPRWDEGDNPALVEVLKDGSLQPFPGGTWNEWQPGKEVKTALVNLNSSYINREDNHLWVVDAGDPFNGEILPNAPKLVEIDLKTREVANTYFFNEEILPKGSHLNDIRIDGSTVYITESGIGSILLLDRKTRKVRRVLAESKLTKGSTDATVKVENIPLQGTNGKIPVVNADQVELSPKKDSLYFMSPFKPVIYRVATADLKNEKLTEAELEKRVAVDRTVTALGGFIMDDEGNFYLSEIENHTITCHGPDKKVKWKIQDKRLIWPDALSVTPDGTVYVATAQINRMPFMRNGKDDREAPFSIFKFNLKNN